MSQRGLHMIEIKNYEATTLEELRYMYKEYRDKFTKKVAKNMHIRLISLSTSISIDYLPGVWNMARYTIAN